MSESVGCKQPEDPAPRKRCAPPGQDESGPAPCKSTKVTDASNEKPSTSQSSTSSEVERKETTDSAAITVGQGEPSSSSAKPDQTETHGTSGTVEAHSSDLPGTINARGDGGGPECPPSTSMDQSDDSAAIAAAEALASLTAGAGEESKKTSSSSSNKVKRDERESKVKLGARDSFRQSLRTLAAAADSSTSVHSVAGGDVEDIPDTEEEDPGTTPASSSTPSSSFPSDNEEEEEEDEEDGECAIVSVKMAPEIRQSVSLLAQVQMRLEALEKKSVRLHQRLDMKMNRQRRPHLDQRRTITQSIPGFWVTALLNHPHLSAHIDETDEDALSYMIDLEIESFKNSKLGSRIRFHFRRNPYFQNNIIMKEVHLGMGGSPVSFSNPILWHRGQNLTVHSDPRKTPHGVYQTFFSWFSDHSNPGRDDIAQILKDDLYRDPLRYYLTPLWEPRENGSSASGARAADNSNGDDCVVISDSDDDDEDDDDDEEEHSDTGVGHRRGAGGEEEEDDDDDDDDDDDGEEEEEEEGEAKGQGSDYSDQEPREEEESFGDKDEDVYVEDVEELPGDPKAKDREDEGDIDVDEEGGEEDERKD